MMAGEVDLHFYYPVDAGRPLAALVRELIGEFHRTHPHIRVALLFAGGYEKTLRVVEEAVAAGEPVGVTVLYSGVLRALVRSGVLAALDDFISDAGGEAFLADFLPGVLMNARAAGRMLHHR